MFNIKIIITGGNKGIGKEIALNLIEKQYEVLIIGRDMDSLKEMIERSALLNALKADIDKEEGRQAVQQWVKQHWNGQIDGLINNAGAFQITPLKTITKKQFLRLFQTNVFSPALLTSLLLPFLEEEEGAVINISSVVGHRPHPGSSAYGSSKAALSHLTKIWSLELSPQVRVNAVSPGPTETPILQNSGMTPQEIRTLRREEKKRTPMGRIATVQDISKAVAFLLSPDGRFINGQVITVDGGYSL